MKNYEIFCPLVLGKEEGSHGEAISYGQDGEEKECEKQEEELLASRLRMPMAHWTSYMKQNL